MTQIPNIDKTQNSREFMECETCSKKPGSPHLCGGCLHNRSTIENLIEEIVQNKQYLSTEDYIHFLRETLQKIQQTHNQQPQKARHNWLREEIVRLEGIRSNIDDFDYDSDERGKREVLQTIIDRYQAELDQDKTPQDNKK